jgi:hypothetical protein
MAYIWGYTTKIPDYLTASSVRELVPYEISTKLKNGESVLIQQIHYEIQNKKGEKNKSIINWDILNETIGVPLVNKKVLDILEQECLGKFQAIPAIIALPDGTEVKDYWVINVTHKVPVISLENSIKWDRFKEEELITPYRLKTAAYRASVIENEDICRDSTLEANLIFISDRLFNILKKAKIKGMGFHEKLSSAVIFV